MGVRACWAAVVLLLLAVRAFADEREVAFTCTSEGRMFACKASGVDDLWPHWRIFKSGLDYEEYGHEFRYYAPKRWSLIEMIVSDGERTWTLRGYVRLLRGRAKLCKPENIDACRRAAGKR